VTAGSTPKRRGAASGRWSRSKALGGAYSHPSTRNGRPSPARRPQALAAVDKPSGIGIATGAVAGLAAITPASGFVPPWASIVIGGAAGLVRYGAVHLKDLFHYDDSLDVVGVHVVAGALGVVLTGVFDEPRCECGW
jgi:hypothetical protein